MKITYRSLISLSASIGFTFLIISILSIIQTTSMHVAGQPKEGFWDTYLRCSNMLDEYMIHIFAVVFVFMLLFYVAQIQKFRTRRNSY